jgi:hypothetical protein
MYPEMTLLGGTFQGLPAIVSQYAGTNLTLLNAPDIYLADDGGVAVDMSREASLEMESDPTGDSVTRPELNWFPCSRPTAWPFVLSAGSTGSAAVQQRSRLSLV